MTQDFCRFQEEYNIAKFSIFFIAYMWCLATILH